MNKVRGRNLWNFRMKIVSGILTAMLVLAGLVMLLPMSSDVVEGYNMPDGVSWDMDDLVANSTGAVTGGAGTYYVHEDVDIPTNSSLTVDPGETVYFDTATGLNVYGDLYAHGNSSYYIVFTSNESSPSPGDWDGISFYAWRYRSISYFMISYANNGIHLEDTYLNIMYGILHENIVGTYIWLGGQGSFYNVHIYNNTGNGIECYAEPGSGDYISADLYECTIASNGNAGIYCANTRVNITHSNFEFNYLGIQANGSYVNIYESEIAYSSMYDFYLENDTFVYSLNTTFDDNAVFFYNEAELRVLWFLHILVVNASGPVAYAEVTVSDNENGTWSRNYMTDYNGRLNWITVTEYIRTYSNWTFYTPHNITAQKDNEYGYAEPIMDQSKLVVVFISPGGAPPPNQPPVADAGSDQLVFEDEIVYFDGSFSYDPDGFIENYTWNFDDGNFGYGEIPFHVYDTPGVYIVNLTVRDNEGASSYDLCTITVEARPPAPPEDLVIILVPGSLANVMLIWNASADDGEGDGDVAGYTVYKSSTGVDGPYEFAAWIDAEGIAGRTYTWTDIGAGDGNPNNYFYLVRANDTLDNEEQNEIKVGKFASDLVEGWNLVSVPLVQIDTTRELVLQTIEGNYASVYGYHAGKSRPWLHWHRDKPNQFNDEVEINHMEGYYIDMIIPDSLVTVGRVASETDITLKSGWNLVGYPCLTEQERDDALSSISGKYNIVEFYDTSKDKEERLGPTDPMYPGLGYWIHATENCVWTI